MNLEQLALKISLELVGVTEGSKRVRIIENGVRDAVFAALANIFTDTEDVCPECNGVNFHRAECNGAREQQQKEKLGL